MQNRIENPFGAQRGGQTRSKFHASDSAQNQLRIAPESKAESLTVTAPIFHVHDLGRLIQAQAQTESAILESNAPPESLTQKPRFSRRPLTE